MSQVQQRTDPLGLQADLTLLQEELRATNQEVMLLTLELEQRVAERTAQLSQANQELRKEIAERLRAEQEIIQLNKDLARRAELLEAVNQELEAFSSSVAHDLRNPLARILGFASLLRDNADPLQGKDFHYVDRICEAGSQMTNLIDGLLRLAHSATVELACTDVDLNKLVAAVLQQLEPEAAGRAVCWKLATLPVVSADGSLLQQVFLNLISNALKYTRPRNPAEIEIASQADNGSGWVFFVRDNGVGFDPQKASKLFGAFQRLHGKHEFEGTGIGLATVRRIVLRHGGTVWAEAQPDAGAALYFTLPRKS